MGTWRRVGRDVGRMGNADVWAGDAETSTIGDAEG